MSLVKIEWISYDFDSAWELKKAAQSTRPIFQIQPALHSCIARYGWVNQQRGWCNGRHWHREAFLTPTWCVERYSRDCWQRLIHLISFCAEVAWDPVKGREYWRVVLRVVMWWRAKVSRWLNRLERRAWKWRSVMSLYSDENRLCSCWRDSLPPQRQWI